MRNLILFLFAAVLLSSCALLPSGTRSGSPQGEQLSISNGTLRVQFWSNDTVRVTFADSNEMPKLTSLSVVETPAAVHWKRKENDQSIVMVGSRMKVKIDKQTGAVSFLDLSDNVLLRESAQGRIINSQ